MNARNTRNAVDALVVFRVTRKKGDKSKVRNKGRFCGSGVLLTPIYCESEVLARSEPTLFELLLIKQ